MLITLIDKASKVCGSDAELARRLQISHAHITMMRNGKRAITPVIAGLLADISGDDPALAVMAALKDSLAKNPRGQRVLDALERRFLAGAAAIFSTLTTIAVVTSLVWTSQLVNSLYIVSSAVNALVSRVFCSLRSQTPFFRARIGLLWSA